MKSKLGNIADCNQIDCPKCNHVFYVEGLIYKQKVKEAIDTMKNKWCMDIGESFCDDCDVCKQFNDLKEELGL